MQSCGCIRLKHYSDSTLFRSDRSLVWLFLCGMDMNRKDLWREYRKIVYPQTLQSQAETELE